MGKIHHILFFALLICGCTLNTGGGGDREDGTDDADAPDAHDRIDQLLEPRPDPDAPGEDVEIIDDAVEEELVCECDPGETASCTIACLITGYTVEGYRECEDGCTWGACVMYSEGPDLCNGVDDDCDASVDEDCQGGVIFPEPPVEAGRTFILQARHRKALICLVLEYDGPCGHVRDESPEVIDGEEPDALWEWYVRPPAPGFYYFTILHEPDNDVCTYEEVINCLCDEEELFRAVLPVTGAGTCPE